jgi:hypothetical protein
MAEIKDTAADLKDQPTDSKAPVENLKTDESVTVEQVTVGQSIRRSTFIPVGEDEAENVVYVQDKPFKKLVKQVAVTAAVAVLILATAGFIMGLNGLRTPHISGDAISNQWNSIVGDGSGDQNWNELEKNP